MVAFTKALKPELAVNNNKVLSDEQCDVLRDLVPFVQLKKREKHPWRSVNAPQILEEIDILLVLTLITSSCLMGDGFNLAKKKVSQFFRALLHFEVESKTLHES